LIRAIKSCIIPEGNIATFDKGLFSLKNFTTLNNNEITFVTRVRKNITYNIVKQNEINSDDNTDKFEIQQDNIVQLYTKSNTCKTKLRLIIAKTKTDNTLLFLTNNFELSAYDITEIYKKRWEIEVFFRYIKQNLHMKHFISHSKNSMKLYIYSVLISAILFVIYKKKNKLSGYKIALIKFRHAIFVELMKHIVLLCDGNVSKLEDYFSNKSPVTT
jgi:IS4 transposase